MKQDTHVAIIGAGWSGLAAATELAARDIAVTVFEAARQPGGRARTVTRHGLSLDNGQHILLGAYSETLRLLGSLGVTEAQAFHRLPLRLCFPGQLDLAAPLLPAPAHLLAALLMASGLSLGERLAALRLVAGFKLRRFRLGQDVPVAALLAGQPEKVVRLLWEPLCLAALNTPIATASAQVFLNVLRDSFSRARADSDLLLPRRNLGGLLPSAALRFLGERGGSIRLSTPVTMLEPTPEGVVVNGERYSHAICATAPFTAHKLLAGVPEAAATVRLVADFAYQPIATVALQYPRHISLPFPMLGMADGLGQWVFDRGMLTGEKGLLACVISAEGPHLGLGHELLAERVHEELAALLGPLPRFDWHQVIIEKRATYACTAGLERPSNHTAHPRLLIAGDYTAGDYPGTLEAAVRSGVQCAHRILALQS